MTTVDLTAVATNAEMTAIYNAIVKRDKRDKSVRLTARKKFDSKREAQERIDAAMVELDADLSVVKNKKLRKVIGNAEGAEMKRVVGVEPKAAKRDDDPLALPPILDRKNPDVRERVDAAWERVRKQQAIDLAKRRVEASDRDLRRGMDSCSKPFAVKGANGKADLNGFVERDCELVVARKKRDERVLEIYAIARRATRKGEPSKMLARVKLGGQPRGGFRSVEAAQRFAREVFIDRHGFCRHVASLNTNGSYMEAPRIKKWVADCIVARNVEI